MCVCERECVYECVYEYIYESVYEREGGGGGESMDTTDAPSVFSSVSKFAKDSSFGMASYRSSPYKPLFRRLHRDRRQQFEDISSCPIISNIRRSMGVGQGGIVEV